MKVHEIENFPESLTIMFNHFRKHDMKSSLAPVEDFDALYKAIVNSEFHEYQYIDSLNDYSIDFHLEDSSFINKVYWFICKNISGESEFKLLIDFVKEPGSSFLKIDYSLNQHPPFIKGLLDVNDNIMITNLHDGEKIQHVTQSEILSLEAFAKYIDDYSSPGELIWVNVD